MQLIVLGMHRSGTSAVTRLVNMAGAYFGPEGIATSANDENPKGFWERRDVRRVCDGLLQDSGFDWWKVAGFDAQRLDPDALDTHLAAFRDIVAGLDAHRPWVLKEPRLCLLLEALRPALEVPIVIQVTREPTEVAASLSGRNGFSLPVAAALWEHYTLHGLRASADIPRYHVRHGDVLADPVGTLYHLLDWLEANDVAGLRRPSEREITAFVDPDLHRARSQPDARPGLLNGAQAELAGAIDDNSFLSPEWAQRVPSAGGVEILETFEQACAQVDQIAQLEEDLRRAEQQRVDEQRALEAAAERRTSELTVEWESRLQAQEAARAEADERVVTLESELSDRDTALAAAEVAAEQAVHERDAAVHDAEVEAAAAFVAANRQVAELRDAMAKDLQRCRTPARRSAGLDAVEGGRTSDVPPSAAHTWTAAPGPGPARPRAAGPHQGAPRRRRIDHTLVGRTRRRRSSDRRRRRR